MRKFEGISPEILWSNKEAMFLVLIFVGFIILLFNFKSRDHSFKGKALVTQIRREGNPPVRVYYLDIREYNDPPNKRVFMAKVKETERIGLQIAGKRVNQEARVIYQKGPNGDWIIREAFSN